MAWLNLELVSIHFPKAAGSSLGAVLKAHFGDALALDYDHNPANPDHLLRERPTLPEGIRAVHGHFRWDRYIEQRGAFTFTFLREPVDNLFSIYSYWRSVPLHGNAMHRRFLLDPPSILDFARGYRAIRRLMSVTFFGGMDVGFLDFIGFYETRARDLGRLSKRTGLPLESDIYLNRTAPVDDRQLFLQNGSTMSSLRSLLSEDVAFYERAKERWD